MRQLMLTVFKWKGVKNVVAEELSVLPGMEEAAAFLWLDRYYHEGNYDLIVVDCAPTGETLTLLSMPQAMQSWMLKAFPGQSKAVKSLGYVVRKTTGVPLDKGYAELEALFEKLGRIQQIMQQPQICSVRIVANPERMVIQEAKRAYTYLQLYGYHVDALIVNRILPVQPADGFFANYYTTQQQYLAEIHDSFKPLPIFEVPHLGQEVFGLEKLKHIGQGLYSNQDPHAVFYHDTPLQVAEDERFYYLSVKLPFIDTDNISLQKYADELVIQAGSHRRSIILPRFAQLLHLDGHSFTTPWLKVRLLKT